MRVAILGVGGLGRTLASELRGDPRVTSLLLVDLYGERARVLTGIRGRVAIEAKQLNVENRIALTRAIAGVDLVINATLPKYNLGIMQAALDVRANYLDPSAAGPRESGGLAGIFEQLAMGEAFKDAGLSGLVSMGLDPGLSNVMARSAVERLDAIDAIRIRSGGVATLPGYTSFPLYSREVFLAAFPEPSALVLPLEGAESLSVEVEGQKGMKRVVHRGDITLTHQESNRRRSTTAASYLGAVGAAIGTALIADRATPGAGVYPAEALDPTRVFKEWAARNLPMQWSERALDT